MKAPSASGGAIERRPAHGAIVWWDDRQLVAARTFWSAENLSWLIALGAGAVAGAGAALGPWPFASLLIPSTGAVTAALTAALLDVSDHRRFGIRRHARIARSGAPAYRDAAAVQIEIDGRRIVREEVVGVSVEVRTHTHKGQITTQAYLRLVMRSRRTILAIFGDPADAHAAARALRLLLDLPPDAEPDPEPARPPSCLAGILVFGAIIAGVLGFIALSAAGLVAVDQIPDELGAPMRAAIPLAPIALAFAISRVWRLFWDPSG